MEPSTFMEVRGHQVNNFLATETLTGINNFCMGDFEQVFKMQEKFRGKQAMMVCDFAPLQKYDIIQS